MRRRWFVLLGLIAAPLAGAESLTDPTRPEVFAAAEPETPAAQLQLSLVRLGPKPLAVINGSALRVGERIEGYRLLAVSSNQVTLASQSGRLILPLVPSQSPISRSYAPVTTR